MCVRKISAWVEYSSELLSFCSMTNSFSYNHMKNWYCFRKEHSMSLWLFRQSGMSDSLRTPWTAAHQSSLSSTISQSLLKLMSIESVMPSNHLILSWPLLLLPSVFPSIRVFSSESALHLRWPKYWSFSFSISPFNGYSRLISLRTDWFDLLAVQGTLKSFLQRHNSNTQLS